MELETPAGAWRFRALAEQLLACERMHLPQRERVLFTDTSGPHWVGGVVRATRGEIAFWCDGERLVPRGGVYGVYLPPFSLIQSELLGVEQRCALLVSSGAPRASWPSGPVLVDLPDEMPDPSSLEDMETLLRGTLRPISRCARPSALARRTKAAIDASFQGDASLAQVASHLGVTHPQMSRCFKAHFGLPPAAYRSSMRVFTAAIELLRGGSVTETAFRVGFRDLGRFYKQFGAITLATPGRYRARKAGEHSAGKPAD